MRLRPLASTMKELSTGKMSASRGIATLEILIAFAVLMLTLTAMIVVAFSNQSISVDTQTNSEAIAIAKAQLEIAQASAIQNFGLLQTNGPTDISSGPI